MPESLRESFALAVRKCRNEKGWSQEKLATEANVHRTYVSGVERAVRNISIDNIEKIGRALGVDPAELLVTGRNEAAS